MNITTLQDRYNTFIFYVFYTTLCLLSVSGLLYRTSPCCYSSVKSPSRIPESVCSYRRIARRDKGFEKLHVYLHHYPTLFSDPFFPSTIQYALNFQRNDSIHFFSSTHCFRPKGLKSSVLPSGSVYTKLCYN